MNEEHEDGGQQPPSTDPPVVPSAAGEDATPADPAVAEAKRRAAELARRVEERAAATARAVQERKSDLHALRLVAQRLAENAAALTAGAEEFQIDLEAWMVTRQQVAEIERTVLSDYRAVLRENRIAFANPKWLETSEYGRELLAYRADVRTRVDRVAGSKPDDPEYDLLWEIREGSTRLDLSQALQHATWDLRGCPAPMRVLTPQELEIARRDHEFRSSHFDARDSGRRIVVGPNGIGRREVQRIVDALVALRYRAERSAKEERDAQQQALIGLGPETFSTVEDVLFVLDPRRVELGEPIGVAVWVPSIRFQESVRRSVRMWSGVLTLNVKPVTFEDGTMGKEYTVLRALGNIERIAPPGTTLTYAAGETLRADERSLRTQLRYALPFCLLQPFYDAQGAVVDGRGAIGLSAFQPVYERAEIAALGRSGKRVRRDRKPRAPTATDTGGGARVQPAAPASLGAEAPTAPESETGAASTDATPAEGEGAPIGDAPPPETSSDASASAST